MNDCLLRQRQEDLMLHYLAERLIQYTIEAAGEGLTEKQICEAADDFVETFQVPLNRL